MTSGLIPAPRVKVQLSPCTWSTHSDKPTSFVAESRVGDDVSLSGQYVGQFSETDPTHPCQSFVHLFNLLKTHKDVKKGILLQPLGRSSCVMGDSEQSAADSPLRYSSLSSMRINSRPACCRATQPMSPRSCFDKHPLTKPTENDCRFVFEILPA